MQTRTFLYTDAKSNKFWTIALSDDAKAYTVTYGKTGTAGQTLAKDFPTAEACRKAADKLIAEKTGKGYVEQTTACATGISQVAPVSAKAQQATPTASKSPAPASSTGETTKSHKLIPFLVGGKFGFCTPDKNLVLPAIYDGCRQFSEGIAVVQTAGKVSAINIAGETIIPAEYSNIGSFTGGYTFVYKGKKAGLIDKTGTIVIPTKYDNLLMPAKSSGYDANLGIFQAGLVPVEKNDKWGFANLQGEEVVACIYDEVRQFKDGFAIVRNGLRCGFIDKTGREIVAPGNTYSGIEDFSDGLAVAHRRDGWTFLDTEGNEVMSRVFTVISDFSNGIAPVWGRGKGERWGYINKQGEWVIDPIFVEAKPFADGLAAAWPQDSPGHKQGYIDITGKFVLPPAYIHAHDFSEGLAFVAFDYGDGRSVIDKQGNILGTLDGCSQAGTYTNGMAIVQVNDRKWGALNHQGQPVVKVCFDKINSFIEGVARVEAPKEFPKYAFVGDDGTQYWQKDASIKQHATKQKQAFKSTLTPVPPKTLVLDDTTFPKHTEHLAAKLADEYYSIGKHIVYPFLDFIEENNDESQQIRVFKGNLHIAGIKSTSERDWNYFSLIVDGDLTLDGDLDWSEGAEGSFIYITGNLKARNLILEGNPNIYVAGNVELTGGVLCHHGDDGGRLDVDGKTKARFIIATTYFLTGFAKKPTAIMLTDDDDSDASFPQIIAPQYLDKHGALDERKLAQALAEGKDPLLETKSKRKKK